jgi:hypothetical protein
VESRQEEEMYEYKITKNQVVWYEDGKRVARKEVPLKEKIRAKKEIDRGQLEPSVTDSTKSSTTPIEKHCIVCGEYPQFTRFYNNQIWEVCEDCYYNKTLGQIAEAVRSKNV